MRPPASRATRVWHCVGRLPWGVIVLAAGVSASLAWRLDAIAGPARYVFALAAGVMTLAVAGRRPYPLQTWAIVTAGCAVLIIVMPEQGSVAVQVPLPVFAAPLIALYSVTVHASRRQGRVALLTSAVALGVALSREYIIGTAPSDAAGLRCGPSPTMRCVALPHIGAGTSYDRAGGIQIVLIFLAGLVAAWALGERARASSETVTAMAERAGALEAARAGQELAAAADERARIAAELHDITAHHISVVALQAGAARMLAEHGQPADVDLLRDIESTSRQAMAEIRQALGVIRSTAGGSVPHPGTAQLPELVARLTGAGLAVTIEGSAGPLPSHLDLAVYRIVQESLSNVLRHSAASAARVEFRLAAGRVEIVVADGGPPRERRALAADGAPTGQGLNGLHERVRRLGGQFQTGTRSDGGFEVRAVLPVPASKAATAKDTSQHPSNQVSLHAEAAT